MKRLNFVRKFSILFLFLFIVCAPLTTIIYAQKLEVTRTLLPASPPITPPNPSITPSPIPTATPNPTVTPIPTVTPEPTITPKPTITSIPTKTPTPIPTPINRVPVFSTKTLPSAYYGRTYKTTISGFDYNAQDTLTMRISKGILPKGLTFGKCTTTRNSRSAQVNISCPITGVPSGGIGTHLFTVTLADNRGAKATREFFVKVIRSGIIINQVKK